MGKVINMFGKHVDDVVKTTTKNLDNATKAANNVINFKPTKTALEDLSISVRNSDNVININTTRPAIDTHNARVKNSDNVVQFKTTQKAQQKVVNANQESAKVINFQTAKEARQAAENANRQTAKVYDFQEARNKKFNKTNSEPNYTNLDPIDTPKPPPEAKPNPNGNFNYNNYEKVKFNPDKVSEIYNKSKMNNTNNNTNNKGFDFGEFGNKYFGGVKDTYQGTKAGDGFWNSLQSAHKNADGSYRWDRIAGTYAAVALGSRVLSGGGLTKDKYGNTNLPGIPFI